MMHSLRLNGNLSISHVAGNFKNAKYNEKRAFLNCTAVWERNISFILKKFKNFAQIWDCSYQFLLIWNLIYHEILLILLIERHLSALLRKFHNPKAFNLPQKFSLEISRNKQRIFPINHWKVTTSITISRNLWARIFSERWLAAKNKKFPVSNKIIRFAEIPA